GLLSDTLSALLFSAPLSDFFFLTFPRPPSPTLFPYTTLFRSHSQLSSSTFAKAAHIPPCAAPVCERVGYSFVSTAVRVRCPASLVARMPEPPAPTITTSYFCTCIS